MVFWSSSRSCTRRKRWKTAPGTEAIRAEDSGFLTYRKKILSPVQKKKVPIWWLMYGNCGIKAEEGLAWSRYPCVWQTYFPKFIDPVIAAGPALLMKIGIYMTAEKQRQPANGSPIGGWFCSGQESVTEKRVSRARWLTGKTLQLCFGKSINSMECL